MKSVKPIDEDNDAPPPGSGRNADTDLHGTTRTNATHASTTDPEAKLYRKSAGTEAKLAFLGGARQGPRQAELGGVTSGGHALMENRCGFIVDACLT